MNEMKCPTCGIELVSHEAKRCLETWVASALGLVICTKEEAIKKTNAAFPTLMSWDCWYCFDLYIFENPMPAIGLERLPSYSSDTEFAFALMEKVREMDPQACIVNGAILVQIEGRKAPHHVVIEGDTFPLRVCRAFLFLKNQGKKV